MKHREGFIPIRKLKPLTYLKREEWGALPAKEGLELEQLLPIKYPVEKVITSYTEDKICYDTAECVQRLREIQKNHMDEGLADIRYSFLIGGDGNVYEGRGWKYIPAENGSWPEWHGETYEFAHIGFHGKQLPDFMAKAAWDMWQVGIQENYLTKEYDIHPDIFKINAEIAEAREARDAKDAKDARESNNKDNKDNKES